MISPRDRNKIFSRSFSLDFYALSGGSGSLNSASNWLNLSAYSFTLLMLSEFFAGFAWLSVASFNTETSKLFSFLISDTRSESPSIMSFICRASFFRKSYCLKCIFRDKSPLETFLNELLKFINGPQNLWVITI